MLVVTVAVVTDVAFCADVVVGWEWRASVVDTAVAGAVRLEKTADVAADVVASEWMSGRAGIVVVVAVGAVEAVLGCCLGDAGTV